MCSLFCSISAKAQPLVAYIFVDMAPKASSLSGQDKRSKQVSEVMKQRVGKAFKPAILPTKTASSKVKAMKIAINKGGNKKPKAKAKSKTPKGKFEKALKTMKAPKASKGARQPVACRFLLCEVGN